jgi:hypothetical protein
VTRRTSVETAEPETAKTETAKADLLIDRPDLGPGAATLVAAGDEIPPELADRPRRDRGAILTEPAPPPPTLA